MYVLQKKLIIRSIGVKWEIHGTIILPIIVPAGIVCDDCIKIVSKAIVPIS